MNVLFREEERQSCKWPVQIIELPVPLQPLGARVFAFHSNPFLQKHHLDVHVEKEVEDWPDLFIDYVLMHSRYDAPTVDMYLRVSGYNLFSNLMVCFVVCREKRAKGELWWALGLDGVMLYIEANPGQEPTIATSFRADIARRDGRKLLAYDHFRLLYRKLESAVEDIRFSSQESGEQNVSLVLEPCPSLLEWSRIRNEYRTKLKEKWGTKP